MSRKPVHVLYVPGTAGVGGMTRVLVGLLSRLPRSAVRPTVALPPRHPARGPLRRMGVPCFSLSGADDSEGLIRLIRRSRSQLVHSYDPAGAGGLAARRCGVPHLWELPGIPPGIFPEADARGGAFFDGGPRIRRERAQAFPAVADLLADAVVVHCRDLARRLCRSSLRCKLHVIPPVGVDGKSALHGQTRLRRKPAREPTPRVALVGNFYPAKRHLDFLRAARRIRWEIPSARFLIAGRCVGLRPDALRRSRRYRERVLRAARRPPLRGHLLLTRYRPSEWIRWMRGMDVLVVPSLEGLSQAMLEAAACGVPIVAARAGGQKDLLENGRSGFLVPLGDPESIARAVVRLLRDPRRARRMGEAARRRLLRRLSAEDHARGFLKLYRRILRSSAGRPHQGTRTP